MQKKTFFLQFISRHGLFLAGFLYLILCYIPGTCYGQARISNTLYSVYIDKTTFNSVYENSGDEKIVLQFTLDVSTPAALLTLSAWASKDHDYNEDKPEAVFTINNTTSILVPSNFILGDQQIKRNAIRKINKSFIDDSSLQYLILDPKKNNDNNHIYYDIYVEAALSPPYLKTKVGKTDPSPPAHSN